jgi:hypothetical protein
VHTLIVVAIGLALLGLCALAGNLLGGAPGVATAALIFLPLWIVGAGINMFIGVKRAGYSIADEAPVFVVVFAIPAAAALVAWWRIR